MASLRQSARDVGRLGRYDLVAVEPSKDSSLDYSSNWVYDSATKAWRKMPQAIKDQSTTDWLVP